MLFSLFQVWIFLVLVVAYLTRVALQGVLQQNKKCEKQAVFGKESSFVERTSG